MINKYLPKKRKCYICGEDSIFSMPAGIENPVLFREAKCEKCSASLRNSSVAQSIVNYFLKMDVSLLESLDDIRSSKISIYNTISSGPIHDVLKDCPNYVCSEYFDNVALGSYKNGVLCQNLENLTFLDSSFDLVITEEVLEHVCDYKKAFLEIYRVLSPGGYHIFTVPLHEGARTIKRDELDCGGDVLHGDTIKNGGIKVFIDFGDDICNFLKDFGFKTEIFKADTWYLNDEITKITTNEEYEKYKSKENDLLSFFKYNNNVLISKKIFMQFTGERMIPDFNKADEIYQEHLNRYFFASQFIDDKVVLDIACGSGYGSDLLLKSGARTVIGVDISQDAIDYCKEKYVGIEFRQGSAEKIPLDEKSVDVLVSFETIEHINEEAQAIFMNEIRRVLKSNGLLIISTPNSLVYPKGNKFHMKELTVDEFKTMLSNKFSNVRFFYQDMMEVDYVFSEETLNSEILLESDIKINTKKINKAEALDSMYLIALCSDVNLHEKIEENIMISNKKPRKIFKKINNDYENYIEMLGHEREQEKKILKQKEQIMEQKENEIELMKSSKFWKLRNIYMSLKDKLMLR